MTAARRFARALAGTPLADPLPGPAAAFLEARGRDAALAALPDDALRGLARVVASQGEVAIFLSHRSHFAERLATLSAPALAERGEGFAADERTLLELDLEAALDALRIRRREETAFAACADLAGLAPFEAVSEFLSRLAESTIGIALALARRELRTDDRDEFAVIGMGKLAGRELTYHSDLDLIFLFRGGPEQISRASRLGQRLISYLTTMTGAGIAYPVDTRLRPSGRQGMLVTSFEAFERYQREQAQTWEHLAQLRGRAVAGTSSATPLLDRVHAHIMDLHTEVWKELDEMRERVRSERADEQGAAIAFKTGAGGLMDVDFLAGGGLLERGPDRFPRLPSVPAMLRACASGPAVDALLRDYAFLRIVEARARWVAGRGVETLRPQDAATSVTAELVEPGLGADALAARTRETCARIRAHYESVIRAGSLSGLEPSAT